MFDDFELGTICVLAIDDDLFVYTAYTMSAGFQRIEYVWKSTEGLCLDVWVNKFSKNWKFFWSL